MSDRRAWLQSLQKGDKVIVQLKGCIPYESTVVNTEGRTITVAEASSKTSRLPAKKGVRTVGRFSKLHGHRVAHSPSVHWQDTDYIEPVDTQESIDAVRSNIVLPIEDMSKVLIGFKILDRSISLSEAAHILQFLSMYPQLKNE